MYKKYIVLLVMFVSFICEPCYPQSKYNEHVFIDVDTVINISDCEASLYGGEACYNFDSKRFPASHLVIMTIPKGYKGYYYVGKYYGGDTRADPWLHCYKLSADNKKLIWCDRFK
jgi:hypothetical protein